MKRFVCLIGLLSTFILSCKPRVGPDSGLREGDAFLNEPTFGFVESVGFLNQTAVEVQETVADPEYALVYAADLKGMVSILNSDTGKIVARSNRQSDYTFRTIAMVPAGESRLIAVGTADGSVLWGKWSRNSNTFEMTALPEVFKPTSVDSDASVKGLGFGLGGEFLVAASKNGEVRMWVPTQPYGFETIDFVEELKHPERSNLATNSLFVLGDNRILVARGSGLEVWNPLNCTSGPLFGYGPGPSGQSSLRITKIAAQNSPGEQCAAVVAGTESTNQSQQSFGSTLMFFNLPILSKRFVPKKGICEAYRKVYERAIEANQNYRRPNETDEAHGELVVERNRLEPKKLECLGHSPQVGEYKKEYVKLKDFKDIQVRGGIFWTIEPDQVSVHRDVVTAVSITKGGKYLISAGLDSSIVLWDFKSKKILRTLLPKYADGGIGSVAAGANANRVFFTNTGGSELRSWNVGRMNTSHSLTAKPASAVAFSSVSDRIFIGTSDGVIAKTLPTRFSWNQPNDGAETAIQMPAVTSVETVYTGENGDTEALLVGHCDGTASWLTVGGNGALEKKHSFSWQEFGKDNTQVEGKTLQPFNADCLAYGAKAHASSGVPFGKFVYVFTPLTDGPHYAVWDSETMKPVGLVPFGSTQQGKAAMAAVTVPYTVKNPNAPQTGDEQAATRTVDIDIWPKQAHVSEGNGVASVWAVPWMRRGLGSQSGALKAENHFGITLSPSGQVYVMDTGLSETNDEQAAEKEDQASAVADQPFSGGFVKLTDGAAGVAYRDDINLFVTYQKNQKGFVSWSANDPKSSHFSFPMKEVGQPQSVENVRDLALRKDGLFATASQAGVQLWWANQTLNE